MQQVLHTYSVATVLDIIRALMYHAEREGVGQTMRIDVLNNRGFHMLTAALSASSDPVVLEIACEALDLLTAGEAERVCTAVVRRARVGFKQFLVTYRCDMFLHLRAFSQSRFVAAQS